MKSMFSKVATTTGLITAAQFATAHPGHDHSFWASNAIHAGLVIALIITGIIGNQLIKKSSHTQKIKSEDK